MHITEVVNNMAELGHSVCVVGFLASRPKHLNPSVEFNNIAIRNRRLRNYCDPTFVRRLAGWGRKRILTGRMCSFYESWLEDLMDTVPFDLVYERSNQWNLAVGQASRRQIPSILEFNGIWPIEAEDKGHPAREVQHFTKVEFAAARLASRLVCVGQGAKDYYVAKGLDAAKIHVIPNGANPHFFRPMDRTQCRERLSFGLDDKIIGFSGSLQNFYEIDCVIRAMPLLLNWVPNARLVVVGRDYPPPYGPGRSALLSLASSLGVASKITFLDVVPYEEVPYYINSFDVCLLPLVERSNWRAALSPLKLREYLACGRPVVASDVAGDVQNLNTIGAGLLYTLGDEREMAQKVCAVLQDAGLAREMSDNGRRYVVEHGTWRHVTERILRVAEEIVASPPVAFWPSEQP